MHVIHVSFKYILKHLSEILHVSILEEHRQVIHKLK